jgi:hypothetical protein
MIAVSAVRVSEISLCAKHFETGFPAQAHSAVWMLVHRLLLFLS